MKVSKFKFYVLFLLLFSNIYYSQFNTLYHKEATEVNYQVNSEKKTGNIFLDMPAQKNDTVKENEKKRNKKKDRKKSKNEFSFKDSLDHYYLQKFDTIITKRPNIVKKKQKVVSNEVDYEDVDQEIVYKTFPLIYEESEQIERKPLVKQKIHMPVNSIHVTSKYGYRVHPVYGTKKLHSGVDLRANYDNVYSVMNGFVSDTGYTSKNGNYIVIQHKHYSTYYLHLSKVLVERNEFVKPGDMIAISGNTGTSTAPHLHFAVKENDKFINPINFLNDLIIANNAIAHYGTNKRQITQR